MKVWEQWRERCREAEARGAECAVAQERAEAALREARDELAVCRPLAESLLRSIFRVNYVFGRAEAPDGE